MGQVMGEDATSRHPPRRVPISVKRRTARAAALSCCDSRFLLPNLTVCSRAFRSKRGLGARRYPTKDLFQLVENPQARNEPCRFLIA